jgi:hypothetical protein
MAKQYFRIWVESGHEYESDRTAKRYDTSPSKGVYLLTSTQLEDANVSCPELGRHAREEAKPL